MTKRRLQRQPLVVAIFAACLSMSLVPLAQAQDAPAQAAPAQDQAAPTTQAPDQDKPVTLDTVVVTAQKREERMQDVPIIVNALPQELLQDTGVHDIKDMQTLVPGLTVTSTQSEAQTTIRIRGIGTVGDNAGLESSVGVVVDGVYRPRNGVGFGDLGELERIEVLKGPQSTVFGKNTSAGVVNVITRHPDYETSLQGEFTYGNYGAFGVAGAFNTAMGDNAAFRIFAARRKRDGFTRVVTGAGPRTETEDGNQDFNSVRAQLLLEPTDNWSLLLIADHTVRDEDCCVGVTTDRGPTAGIINALSGGEGVIPVADPDRRVAYSNRSTAQNIKDQGLSLQSTTDLGWFGGSTLTSITSWREWDSINGLDFDFTTADILYRNPRENESFTGFRTYTSEYRLAGSTDRVDWLVGAFFSHEDLDRKESYRIGPAYEPYLSIALLSRINPALGGLPNAPTFLSDTTGQPYGTAFVGYGAQDAYQQTATSTALFTNNTWHATDAFDLTMGLRYTKEDKTLDAAYSNPNGSAGCASYFAADGSISPVAIGRIANALTTRGVPFASLPPAQQQALIGNIVGFSCLPWANVLHDGRSTHQERTEKEWSGTLKAAYRWNEHVMTYLSGARGYKAGGFNLDRVQSANGLSSGTAGIVPVDDTSFPGEFVDSYELGAKTTWAGGNLLLNASLFHQTYSDFQLNSFLGTSFVVRSIPKVVSQGIDAEVLWQSDNGLSFQGGVTYADTKYGDDPLPDADLALLPGSTASFAPKWSATGSMTYEWDFSDALQGRFNLGAKYSSSYNTGSDLDPQKEQSAYTLFNARFSLGPEDGRWAVELWGQNLTNKTYKQVGFDAPLQTGSWNAFLGAPRTYGATLRLRY